MAIPLRLSLSACSAAIISEAGPMSSWLVSPVYALNSVQFARQKDWLRENFVEMCVKTLGVLSLDVIELENVHSL